MEDDLQTANGMVNGWKCGMKEGKKISELEGEEEDIGIDTVDRAMVCEL